MKARLGTARAPAEAGHARPPGSEAWNRFARSRILAHANATRNQVSADPTDTPRPFPDVDLLSEGEPLREGTFITPRRRHSSIHGRFPALAAHLVATTYRGEQQIIWRDHGRTIASRLRRGAITLIPAEIEGRLECHDAVEMSQVFLPEARLKSCAAELGWGGDATPILRIGFDDGRTASILEMLADSAAGSDCSGRLFAEQCIDILCLQLLRDHSSLGRMPERPRRGLAEWQVRRVTAYMRDHLHRVIGLDELAALVGLSRFHFCTAFRVATGRTPHDWLTGHRIERAIDLLEGTDWSVTEIALEVGYETPSAFTARFRRRMGITPSDYRRQARPRPSGRNWPD